MVMPENFCAFILTHGRPNSVHTYKTLKRAGYTGKIYIVIDDEDKSADEYRARFGDMVLQFCKKEISEQIDEGDNFQDRRVIIYARNACWDLARQVGCKYFIQLDDDYTSFRLRFNSGLSLGTFNCKPLDSVFEALLGFYRKTPSLTVAASQGADLALSPKLRRKCMNSFICSVDRPFQFFGRVNEDVNTYVTLGLRGNLFFTVMQAQLNQIQTQSNAGGMTDLYLDSGTYVKSFYTVMYSPSCAKIGVLKAFEQSGRIHHKINWHNTAPKILREANKKC